MPLLAGCAVAEDKSVVPEPTGSVSAPGDTVSTPAPDASIALTCGAVSMIQTKLMNSRNDLTLGTITEAQWVYAINSVVTDYRALKSFGETWGLRDETLSAVSYFQNADALPSGALFDPADSTFLSIGYRFASACEVNGTPTTAFSTTGG